MPRLQSVTEATIYTSRIKGNTADNNLQPESKSWVEKCIHRNRLSDSTHLR